MALKPGDPDTVRLASMGGIAKAAKYPASQLTAAATRAADQRFIVQARAMHPDADEQEIVRVAGLLRRLHLKKAAHKRWAKNRKPEPFVLQEPGE